MSRTLILTLAAAATITVASFASNSSYAHGFGGGGHASFGGHASVGGHVGTTRLNGGGRVAGNGGRTFNPGHPGHGYPGRGYPGRPGHWAGHPGGHWIFRGGRWIVVDPVVGGVDDAAPVSAAGPGPCTCLTKTYTQDGLVVFADVCTKEAASARVGGGASSDATPVPPANTQSNDTAPVAPAADATQAPTSTNYAGLTYQDFLAAQAQKN